MCQDIYPGTCIKLPKLNNPIPHLWIVLTFPDQNSNVLIVNLTEKREGSDTTVVLYPGEHRSIYKETVVYYADARKAPAKALEEISQKPDYDFDDDLSDELLEKIKSGLLQADVAPAIKTYFLENR